MNRLIVLLLASVLVASCGGGGGGLSRSEESGSTSSPASPSPPALPPAMAAAGIWQGFTDTGQTFSSVITGVGNYWITYSIPGDSSVIAGFIQGSVTSQDENAFSSDNGKDFNMLESKVDNLTLSADYWTKQSINAIATYQQSQATVVFTGNYNVEYELYPSNDTIAGVYSGYAVTPAGNEAVNFGITTTGFLSGNSAFGCYFIGSVSPNSQGNVYNISITFAGFVCPSGNDTFTGIGYFDPSTQQLQTATLNSFRNGPYVLVGMKSQFEPPPLPPTPAPPGLPTPNPPEPGPSDCQPQCCKCCTTGKACGDTCIEETDLCTIEGGCACNSTSALLSADPTTWLVASTSILLVGAGSGNCRTR